MALNMDEQQKMKPESTPQISHPPLTCTCFPPDKTK